MIAKPKAPHRDCNTCKILYSVEFSDRAVCLGDMCNSKPRNRLSDECNVESNRAILNGLDLYLASICRCVSCTELLRQKHRHEDSDNGEA